MEEDPLLLIGEHSCWAVEPGFQVSGRVWGGWAWAQGEEEQARAGLKSAVEATTGTCALLWAVEPDMVLLCLAK